MKKVRLFMVLALLTSMMGNSVYASEITGSGTGSSDAVLNTESAAFSVTLPMGLPIHVDSDGAVTVSDEAKLVNNSYGAVKVTGVEVLGANGWTVIDYDTETKSLKVGAKEFGFMLNGGKTVDGVLEFDETNYPVLAGMNATDSDEMELVYNAIVAPQNVALADEKIADVVFIVDWDGTEEQETPDLPDEPESEVPTTYASIYGHMGEDFVSALETGTVVVENESNFIFDSVTGTITGTTLNKTSDFALVIPSEIDGIPVKNIGRNAFSSKTGRWIKTLAIPYGVETIDERAFYVYISNADSTSENRRLEKLIIPDSVTKIGKEAFYYGTYYNEKTYGTQVRSQLREIKLSDNLKEIGVSAFSNQGNLLAIELPETLETIGNSAFVSTGLTSVTIPNNVVSIGTGAFGNGANLSSVTILGNPTMGSGVFANNKVLQTVTLAEGLTSIPEKAFENCNLKNITLPSTLETIGQYSLSRGFSGTPTVYTNRYLTKVVNKSPKITLQNLLPALRHPSVNATIATGTAISTTGKISVLPDNSWDSIMDRFTTIVAE
jgi:hypothetical protein